MNASTEALVWRIAEALARCPECKGTGWRDPEFLGGTQPCTTCAQTGRRDVELLDECPGIWTGIGTISCGADHDPKLRYHPEKACRCHGTGYVVPSEEKCFWRLLAVGQPVLGMKRWKHLAEQIRLLPPDKWLDALAAAVAAAKGVR